MIQKQVLRDFLGGPWLRLCTSNAEGMGLHPQSGTKILSMPYSMAKNKNDKQNKIETIKTKQNKNPGLSSWKVYNLN